MTITTTASTTAALERRGPLCLLARVYEHGLDWRGSHWSEQEEAQENCNSWRIHPDDRVDGNRLRRPQSTPSSYSSRHPYGYVHNYCDRINDRGHSHYNFTLTVN